MIQIDKRILRILAGSGFVAAIARAASFAMFAFAARAFDTNDFAGLVFIVGTSQLLAQFGAMGWTNLINRVVPRFTSQEASLAKGFFERSIQLPMIYSAIIALLFAAISGVFFDHSTLVTSAYYTALLLLPSVASLIGRSYLVAIGRPVAGVATSDAIPVVIGLGTIILLPNATLTNTALAITVGYITATAIQIWLLRDHFKKFLSAPVSNYSTLQWSKIAALTVVGFVGKLLIDRVDTILLAPMKGMEQLAYYGAATRIAILLIFIPLLMLPVFAPQVSAAYAARNFHKIRQSVKTQISIIAITSVPIAGVLLVAPQQILTLIYGGTYYLGAQVLVISAISQLVYSLSLPLSNLLIMTRGERSYAVASALGCIATFGLGLPLTSSLGMTGAAWAVLAGVIIMATALGASALQILKA